MKKCALYTFLALAFISTSVMAELLKDRSLEIDGTKRTYDIFTPNKNLKNLSPLVILLHGHFGDADTMTGENGKKAPYKLWVDIADREGWHLVIPEGEFGPDGKRGWNDCRANNTINPKTNDVKFINALVEKLAKKYPIDKKRVYVHGTSNGGIMAYRLAQESGDKYRAIAAVVASMPEKNKCEHLRVPVSVLIMNGTEDPLVPYEGGGIGRRKALHGERGSVLSTIDSMDYWVRNNNIKVKPIVRQIPDIEKSDKSTIYVEQYLNQKNNTEVILYEVRGGGHTEPSLSEHYRRLYKLIVGRQNRDIEMAEEVWRFFDRNR
ncbi:MAG: prolyl oligopeptidase family serine peptidase [Pseudomonadales bacterium]|nr:prolyl oligopeptidase family serine peptidase [Pseudomonadales bacterium]